MSDVLTFRVALPPRELSPNGAGEGARRWKNDAKRTYQREVFVCALDAVNRSGWVRPEKARVSLVWGLGADGRKGANPWYRPRDADNAIAAWKAGYDGLKQAGVIVDDDWEHMILGEVRADVSAGPFVEVVVEAI